MTEYVYRAGSLLIEARNAPEAAEFAKLLGVVDSPQLVQRPNDDDLVQAKQNSNRALAKIEAQLIG